MSVLSSMDAYAMTYCRRPVLIENGRKIAVPLGVTKALDFELQAAAGSQPHRPGWDVGTRETIPSHAISILVFVSHDGARSAHGGRVYLKSRPGPRA